MKIKTGELYKAKMDLRLGIEKGDFILLLSYKKTNAVGKHLTGKKKKIIYNLLWCKYGKVIPLYLYPHMNKTTLDTLFLKYFEPLENSSNINH